MADTSEPQPPNDPSPPSGPSPQKGPPSPNDRPPNNPHTVYVGNIPFTTNVNHLGQFFSQAGTVTHIRLVYDKHNGRPKGFAFCEFSDAQGAENAIRDLNGINYLGRTIRVSLAKL